MKKAAVNSVLDGFPKEFKLDDLVEKLIVLEKIEEGLKDVKEGKTVNHEEVKKLIKKWHK